MAKIAGVVVLGVMGVFAVKVNSAQIHLSRTETVAGEQIECGFRAAAESGDSLKQLQRNCGSESLSS